MVDDDLADIRRHAEDCDRRLLTIESDGKFRDAELASLRSSRHEHGNILTQHELSIRAITQSMTETYSRRLGELDKGASAMNDVIAEHGRKIDGLASDAKLLAWKIGLILSIVVFIANQIASRFHF